MAVLLAVLALVLDAAAAGAVSPLGQLVPTGTGEALGAAAASGGVVFAGAPAATFSETGQGAVFAFAPAGGVTHEAAILAAPDPVAGAGLGQWVSADGSTVAVGSKSGQVYVFTEPPGGWSGVVLPAATLSASDSGHLGAPTIAGQTIVAGGSDAVYVFNEPAAGWSGALHESAELEAPDALDLGASVAVQGTTVIAGAPMAKVGNEYPGAAYVFTEPAGGWSGAVQASAKLTGSDITTNNGLVPIATTFGSAVAISGDQVFVALPFFPSQSGAVYEFTEPAGGWQSETQSAKLIASGGVIASGQFLFQSPGLAASTGTVAASGFIGSNAAGPPTVFVFTEPSGGWSGTVIQSAALTSSDGDPVNTPMIDGGQVLSGPISALSPQDIVATGPVDVFDQPAGGWAGTVNQSARLAGVPPTAPTGSEYLFAQTSSGAPSATMTPSGNPSTVSFTSAAASGPIAVATGAGGAYVFARTAGGWSGGAPVASLVDASGDQLVSPSVSGTTIAAVAKVPANVVAQSTVDVFSEPGGGWSGRVQQAATLAPSDGSGVYAAAISGGTVAALADGAHGIGLYIFTEPATGWSGTIRESARLPLSDEHVYPRTVSIDGGTIVINGTIAGSTVYAPLTTAYVYTAAASGWQPAATLTPEYYAGGQVAVYNEPARGWTGTVDPSARLLLAGPGGTPAAISTSGSTVAIAAYQEGTSQEDYCPCSGDVWLFAEPAGGWHGTLTAPAATSAETDGNADIALALDGDTLLAGGQAIPQDTAQTALGVFGVVPPIAESNVVPGHPRLVGARLVALARARARLHFTVVPGSNESPIASVTITLPAGLRFSRGISVLGRGLKVRGAPLTSARVTDGRLRLTFSAFGVKPVTATIAAPALLMRGTLSGTIRTVIAVTDALQHTARFTIETSIR